jgi:hypothetical protein
VGALREGSHRVRSDRRGNGLRPPQARRTPNFSWEITLAPLTPPSPPAGMRDMHFSDAVQGLMAGDFSRLAPLFEASLQSSEPQIVAWHQAGLFKDEPEVLNEAFTCACFNGNCEVIEYHLSRGVHPSGGAMTGLNGFHWAANRGQLKAVDILIRHQAPLETRNAYGGTVLGGAVWAAVHEPKPQHAEVIEALLRAGACVREAEYPTGVDRIDRILIQFGARACGN